MNKTSAREWLNKAWHHLSSAKILYDAEHYTDVIAVDLHYGIEVSMKSFLAYKNQKIVKTHDLIEISELIKDEITFDYEDRKLLVLISTYHIRGSYPPKDRRMPSREEMQKVIAFAEEVFGKICGILDINMKEVQR